MSTVEGVLHVLAGRFGVDYIDFEVTQMQCQDRPVAAYPLQSLTFYRFTGDIQNTLGSSARTELAILNRDLQRSIGT